MRSIARAQSAGMPIARDAADAIPSAVPFPARLRRISPLAFNGLIYVRRPPTTSFPPSARVILLAGSFADVEI